MQLLTSAWYHGHSWEWRGMRYVGLEVLFLLSAKILLFWLQLNLTSDLNLNVLLLNVKSKAMVFSQKRVECSLQVKGETLPLVEEFKHLGILFKSDAMKRAWDRQIDQVSIITVISDWKKKLISSGSTGQTQEKLSAWECLEIPLEEMEFVPWNQEVWTDLLCDPHQANEWINQSTNQNQMKSQNTKLEPK